MTRLRAPDTSIASMHCFKLDARARCASISARVGDDGSSYMFWIGMGHARVDGLRGDAGEVVA
jgi:hypothetical protein